MTREEFVDYMSEVAYSQFGGSFRDSWTALYDNYALTTGVDLREEARKKPSRRINIIRFAENEGLLEELSEIAFQSFGEP